MNRREFLKTGVVLGSAFALGRGAAAAAANDAKPNVVYILADDLGFGDVGCLNPTSKIPTPRMDSLAADGMRFTDAHSPSAVCTPTRYGVLTGRYCWRTPLKRGVLHGYDAPLLEPGRTTVASLLRDQGYSTACVGKWHLGLGWRRKEGAAEGKPSEKNVDFALPLSAGPHTAGFDYSYIVPASLDMDPYVYVENGKVITPPTDRVPNSPRPAYWRGGPAAPGFSHEACLSELTGKATEFIDARGKEPERPFFLYFALTSPHTPHVPREAFRGKSAAGFYGDFVMETDWAVGQVLDALKRNGMDGNTLVILTSDNGSHTEPLNLQERYGHAGNGPYRGQKSDAWDGGHRVPFLARWPGKVPAGSACDRTTCLTDLLATCAAITGAGLPEDAGEDSADALPLLLGKADAPEREATVHHSIDGHFAIRQGPWKLVECRGSGGWSLKEEKVPAGSPAGQLYNMADDPGERRNLYAEKPEVVARLGRLLESYRQEGRSVRRNRRAIP